MLLKVHMVDYFTVPRIGLMKFFFVKKYSVTLDCVKEYFAMYDFVKNILP